MNDNEDIRALVRQQIDKKLKAYGIENMSEEVKKYLLEEVKRDIIEGNVKLEKQDG